MLNEAGLRIPDYIGMDGVQRPVRHANEFWDNYGIPVHRYQSGDLILFSRNGQLPTHIGIVRDEESYIHAPGRENTQVTAEAIAHEAIQHTGILLAPYTVNPIGFKSPVMPVAQASYRYHQRPIPHST